MSDKIKEKMKLYTRMTGSTESASRLVEAESRLEQAEAQRKLAAAMRVRNKQKVA
jgi:hypothetical protein